MRFDVLIFYLWYTLFIFLPALDLDFILAHVAECFNECFGQAGVGNQRNVVVDGPTTDAVTVGQFPFGVVFRDVDNQVELMFRNHLHHIVFCIRTFIRPEHQVVVMP